MRSLASLQKFVKSLSFAVLFFTAFSSHALAEPVAAAVIQAEQAGIAAESISQPGVVPILALSVAAITMMRRRVRQ